MVNFRGKVTKAVVVVLGLAYAGCAVPVPMQTKFDYSELKPYLEPGENSIRGQGFLRQQGGGIVTCAGYVVILVPATSFFRELVTLRLAGKSPRYTDKIDPAFFNHRRTQCDAQGNFSFSNLPNGTWFVMTEVSWVVANARQGGTLVQEVTLSGNETTQVLLTDKDFVGRRFAP